MLAYRWTKSARAAVDGQPEETVVVGLKLKEVIAAAKCRVLDAAVTDFEFLERCMTQRRVGQRVRQTLDGACPRMSHCGNGTIECGQERRGGVLIFEKCRGRVEAYRGHATTDVIADRLGKDRLSRGHDETRADIV